MSNKFQRYTLFALKIYASRIKDIGSLHQRYRLLTCNIAYMYIEHIRFSHNAEPISTM